MSETTPRAGITTLVHALRARASAVLHVLWGPDEEEPVPEPEHRPQTSELPRLVPRRRKRGA